MTQATRDISVIICAYTEKRWDDLVAAVESIKEQTLPANEIIIVIDHNPCLMKQVQENIPGVIVVENTEAKGLSGARNSGITVAKSQLIAFLDDDAVATSNWLMALCEGFDHQEVLGVGGRVIPLWSEGEPAWFPEEFHWVVGCTYRGLPEKRSVVRNPYGGCTCYRREVFEAIGGFTNGIGRVGTRPMGGEETELCIRAKQRWPEKVFLYEPQARIHHRISPNRAHLRYFLLRCYSEGLSKAVVAQYVGAKDSLASERSYALQTLPSGVIRGLMDGFVNFDPSGFLRAGVIAAGLMVTTTGYLMGTLSHRLAFIKGANISNRDSFKQLLNQTINTNTSKM
jgi:glucosyl-dolichyl phosphate glucuronosyltransferase